VLGINRIDRVSDNQCRTPAARLGRRGEGVLVRILLRALLVAVLAIGLANSITGTASASVVSWERVTDADVTVVSATPNRNFGATETLRTAPGVRSYFRVKIDKRANVAVLKLFPMADGPGSKLYLASPDWNESTMTWKGAPPVGAFVANTGPVTMGVWVAIDVTSAVCRPGPLPGCRPGTVGFVITSPKGSSEYAAKENWLQAGPRLVLSVG
jgi:hypothetical protein